MIVMTDGINVAIQLRRDVRYICKSAHVQRIQEQYKIVYC